MEIKYLPNFNDLENKTASTCFSTIGTVSLHQNKIGDYLKWVSGIVAVENEPGLPGSGRPDPFIERGQNEKDETVSCEFYCSRGMLQKEALKD